MPNPAGSFIILTLPTQPIARTAAEHRWSDKR